MALSFLQGAWPSIWNVFPTTGFDAREGCAGGSCKGHLLEYSSYSKAISVLIKENLQLQHEGQGAEGYFEAENDRLH